MRGRVAITTFAALAALALPTGALASTSQQIFSDAADGHLDGSYSQGDLQHAMHDSTVQGYGNPIIQITLSNVINNTNTNNSTSNATSTSNANAAANASCGPGSASASNSGASSNSSSGGGHSCAGSGKQIFTPPVRTGSQTQRQSQTQRGGGGGGTLPFTGSHLAAFLSLGFALLAGGGILRLMARRRSIAG